MITANQVHQIVEENIAGTEKFIVSVSVNPGNKIIVEIDSPQGVTIEEITSIHRFIESKFNREIEDFELTVSSPGLEEPFKHLKQYQKNLGRKVRVVQKSGTVTEGELSETDERGIVITRKTTEKIKNKKQIITTQIAINFDQIIKTRLIL